ncbi:MAG: hypothetical protein ABJE95_20125 [Byssovorax sp.]
MNRSNQIASALALLGFGVLITVVSLGVGNGTYIFAWGAIIGGVIRLVKALAMPENPQLGYDPARDADEPPYSGPQLAGSICTHCRQKIVSHLVGALCKQCNQPVHRDCRKDHRAEAHPKRPRAAYR